METTWRDVRQALRGLRKSPGFSAVALIILALGIGANVAMFSVLHAVALRPLPYRQPDQLVRVWPAENFNITLVDVVKEAMPSLQSVSGLSLWSLTWADAGEPEQLDAAYVSTDHFDLLGVHPMLGRGFAPEESEPGRGDVVVISYGLWQRRFGGDPDVIGRTVRIEASDHATRQVIGVMPPDYKEVRGHPQLWAPLQLPVA